LIVNVAAGREAARRTSRSLSANFTVNRSAPNAAVESSSGYVTLVELTSWKGRPPNGCRCWRVSVTVVSAGEMVGQSN